MVCERNDQWITRRCNRLGQAFKQKVCGYRTTDNFNAMIYCNYKQNELQSLKYQRNHLLGQRTFNKTRERVSVWSHVSLATESVPLSVFTETNLQI